MATQLTVVDAFTDRPFSGNPAAVCLLDRPAPEAWMQAVAREMNLSETAYVVPRDDGDHDLRWFSPATEIDLCGHATLACAHVMGGSQRFHTASGVLTVEPGARGAISLDFPANPVDRVADPPDWAAALGLVPHQVVGAFQRGKWLLVEAVDAAAVRAVVADTATLGGLGGFCLVAADTTAVTTGPDAGHDSVCRMFAPGAGVDEDPVTGSAHCVIGPWLAARHGRDTFVGHQASARGGLVGMRMAGDRVHLSGHAVTVSDVTLHHDPV